MSLDAAWKAGMILSEELFTFAREAFARLMEETLDDPSWMEDPVEEIARMRRVAAELEIDFDRAVEETGTPFERERLLKLEERA